MEDKAAILLQNELIENRLRTEEGFRSLGDSIDKLADAISNLPAPEVNVEAPIVNVPEAVVNVQAPVVNVPAPIVNIPETVVNVPAPVVNVSAPEVTVQEREIQLPSPDFKNLESVIRDLPDAVASAINTKLPKQQVVGAVGGGSMRVRNANDLAINPATEETLGAVKTAIDNLSISGPGGGLTDAELRASPVEVTGSFSVSGGLTDAELRAADVKVTLDGESVPVTGTFWQATQPVSLASIPAAPIPSTITTGGVAISTTTQIAASDANRRKITILNNSDTDILYIGPSGVSTSNGIPVLQYGSMTLETTAAIHGVSSGGAIDVRYITYA